MSLTLGRILLFCYFLCKVNGVISCVRWVAWLIDINVIRLNHLNVVIHQHVMARGWAIHNIDDTPRLHKKFASKKLFVELCALACVLACYHGYLTWSSSHTISAYLGTHASLGENKLSALCTRLHESVIRTTGASKFESRSCIKLTGCTADAT